MADIAEERKIVLKGAKAAGPCNIEVRGDLLLRAIGSGGSKELREAATKAGKLPVNVKASDVVQAIEGGSVAESPVIKTPATTPATK